MSRILPLPSLSRIAVISSVVFVALAGQIARADDNPLKFFKNYFLMVDYIPAGVGMRDLPGQGAQYA